MVLVARQEETEEILVWGVAARETGAKRPVVDAWIGTFTPFIY